MILDTLNGLLTKESEPNVRTIDRLKLRSALRNKQGNPDFGAMEIFEHSLLPRCTDIESSFYISARQISQDIDAFCYQTITTKMKRLRQAGLIEATIIPLPRVANTDEYLIQNYIYGVKILWKN